MKDDKKSKGRKPFKKIAKQVEENLDAKKDLGSDPKLKGNLKNHSKYGNPNWYFTDADLAEQATRFSFTSFIGNGKLTGASRLPSIASFALHPSVGGYVGVTQDYDPSEDNASVQAVNLMARKLYSRLSANSGRTPSYQPQDVIMSILGIGEVLSIHSHLRRVLNTAFTYSKRNRDFPSHIITAMGVNPDDLFSNLAKYRVEFNTILNMANKIPILANITWFTKAMAIYDGIFADSPDEMAQMYMFIPGSTWMIDEVSYEGGTILKTVPFAMDLQTRKPVLKNFSDYLVIFREMINALLTSTTYNLIYADILNMCRKQDVPLMTLPLLRDDEGIVPTYDEEVLLHIHNMNIYSISEPDYYQNTIASLQGRTISNCNDVFQDPEANNIMYAPVFNITGSKSLNDIAASLDPAMKVIKPADLVDFPYGNPDLTERLEATRFSIRLNMDEVFEGEAGEDVWAHAKTLPDHFCTAGFIYVDGSTATGVVLVSTLQLNNNIGSATIYKLEKFRYFPLVYGFNAAADVTATYGDVNYFTSLDGEWLKRLNSLCLQGLLELR